MEEEKKIDEKTLEEFVDSFNVSCDVEPRKFDIPPVDKKEA